MTSLTLIIVLVTMLQIEVYVHLNKVNDSSAKRVGGGGGLEQFDS